MDEDDAQILLAREQILTKSINLSTWNNGTASQVTFAISTCLLDNSAER